VKIVLWLLAIVLLLYLALCVALATFQRSLIYFPPPGGLEDPADTLKLQVPEVSLVVSVRPHDGPRRCSTSAATRKTSRTTCLPSRRYFRTAPST
jgi:hypothetical protein